MNDGKGAQKRRLAFICNNAAFFLSHRLPIAMAAKRRGMSVFLLVGQPGSVTLEPNAIQQLQDAGIPIKVSLFRASGMNPLWEVIGALQLAFWLSRIRPHVIHTVSPKGNLYGGVLARVLRIPRLVQAVSGMGFLFTGNPRGFKAALGRIYRAALGWVRRHPDIHVIVQNEDDRHEALASRVPAPCVSLIPGSGVDLEHFRPPPAGCERNVVLLPARVLWDKGVGEYVAAAKVLAPEFPRWRWVLAGIAGYANPAAVSMAQLEEWTREGPLEWLGHVEDMPELMGATGIVCLPSYREGMPKALLEAAACGCAVVTTDATGCREAIIPGVTGLLVPARTVDALVAALRVLLSNASLRKSMGEAGRRLAVERFGINAVIERTLALYG